MRNISTLAVLSLVALSEATLGGDDNNCKPSRLRRWLCTPLTPQFCSDNCPSQCSGDKWGKDCPQAPQPQLPSYSIYTPAISKSIGISQSIGVSATVAISESIGVSATAPPAPTGGAPSPATETLVTEISDGQPQAPTGNGGTGAPAPAATSAAPVSQISDGQPQAPTGGASAATSAAPAATSAVPVSQISDGQPQAPGTATVVPVPAAASAAQNGTTLLTTPAGTDVGATATSSAPEQFTGAARMNQVGFGANVVLGAAVAAALL